MLSCKTVNNHPDGNVARWAVSFDHLLKDKIGLQVFKVIAVVLLNSIDGITSTLLFSFFSVFFKKNLVKRIWYFGWLVRSTRCWKIRKR